MRYIVSFAHRQYEDINEALRAGKKYEIPLGIYRQLAIVVEARDKEDALRIAERELSWPEAESELVPMGVASQEEAARAARDHADMRRRAQSA